MRSRLSRWLLPVVMIFVALLSPVFAAKPVAVALSRGGKALQPVVVSPAASPRVKQAAQSLAGYLGRMSGAPFTVITGDGTAGLAVGRPGDFPALKLSALFNASDLNGREDYLLRTHARGIYLLGATDAAVEYAVWDLLYRLGYRQYFPGPAWEIVPNKPSLMLAADAREHPDFVARRIWFQYGTWSAQSFRDWSVRNRVGLGVEVWNAHSYGGYIDSNKAEFAAHPEYYGLVNGERKSSKFCISNPAVRALVVQSALAYLKAHPERDCVSVEPSDGGGWCECENCKALGSISDRAVLLANEVAAAVQQEYGNTKLVGMLAYYQHCAPPTLPVHPLVNVSVATAFNSLPVNDMIIGWRAKGASIGIYDYYSVSTWWRDMPGRTNASNLDYLQESLPRFYALGARYFSAESGDNWGVNGLGYVFAARLLWDVDEANRKDAIVDDFLTNCFGIAKGPMAEFYRLTDGSNKEQQLDDLVGRMYRALAQARRSCDDPAIVARIDQLVIYTRYVEMFKAYQAAKGEERQAAFEALMRYVYRVSKTGIIHSLALYEDIPLWDKNITFPKEANWQVPEGKNPWKSTEPFTAEEIGKYLENGVANNAVQPFTPVTYSRNLVPATPLKLPAVPTGAFRSITPDAQTFYTWVAPGQKELKLQVNGARTLTLYAGALSQVPVDKVVVGKTAGVKEPLTAADTIILHPQTSGLYRIERSGGAGGTEMDWQNLPLTFPANSTRFNYSDTILLYFYVPKGTKGIVGYGTSLHGMMLGPDGTQQLAFKDVVGKYYTVPVPPGQDGKLWAMKGIQGPRPLYTVPPFLARNASELLLPKEVVEKDAPTPPPAKK